MKYIIEFEDTPSFAEDGIAYYQCRKVPWWFVGDSIIGRLTSAQDVLSEIDEAYKRGLEEGKKAFDLLESERNSEYQRGLNDAWECARKIVCDDSCGGMSMKELVEIFNRSSDAYILRDFTAQQAIEKLKAYEKEQKADDDVKRGDVVRHKINGLTYIVTLASDCGYVLLGDDGNFATRCITNIFEKTGKHFDIDKILEDMKA